MVSGDCKGGVEKGGRWVEMGRGYGVGIVSTMNLSCLKLHASRSAKQTSHFAAAL